MAQCDEHVQPGGVSVVHPELETEAFILALGVLPGLAGVVACNS
jgi:hypothetical protein